MTDHTPDDLRGMGLVTLAEYEALQAKYGALENTALELRYEIEDLADKAKILLPMPAPQPTREFQVGDKVRIVKSTPWRGHHSGTSKVGLVGVIKRDTRNIPHDSTDWVIETTDGDGYCMTADLELISAAPEIPDWIAEGKWVEFDGRKFLVREWDEFWIRCVKRVFTDGVDKGGSEYLSDVIKHGEPFTPPPMPELPEVFSYDETNPCLLKHKQGTTMPLEAWIAAIQAKKEYWFEETLTKLLAIQAHIEKWGME